MFIFKSLEHLIEHYTKYEDGLPGLLTKSIQSMPMLGIMTIPRQHVPQLTNTNILTSQTSNNKAFRTTSGSGGSNKNVLNNNDLLINQMTHVQQHHSSTSNDFNSKSNALTKASLFKSRTLLNDQSKYNKSISLN
jgi:hypothetical protein